MITEQNGQARNDRLRGKSIGEKIAQRARKRMEALQDDENGTPVWKMA